MKIRRFFIAMFFMGTLALTACHKNTCPAVGQVQDVPTEVEAKV